MLGGGWFTVIVQRQRGQAVDGGAAQAQGAHGDQKEHPEKQEEPHKGQQVRPFFGENSTEHGDSDLELELSGG